MACMRLEKKFIQGICPVWLWILSAIHHTVQFSKWLKQTTREWWHGATSPSSRDIIDLKTSLKESDIGTFKNQINKLKKSGQVDEAILKIHFGNLDDENVLHTILRMENQEAAKDFWKTVSENCQDVTVHNLVSNSHLPQFVRQSEELLVQILISCEYIFRGTAEFFGMEDKSGNTILHKSAKENNKLYRKLLKRLDYSAGCNIDIDFWFIFFLFSGLPAYYLVGTEGWNHTFCLMLHHLVYILHYHSGDLYVLSFLCQKNRSGQTVLDVTSTNYSLFKEVSKSIDCRCKTDFKSIYKTHYSTLNRDMLRTWKYRKGLLVFGAVLGALHQIQTSQTLLEEETTRFLRNVLCAIALAALVGFGWLPRSLSILGLGVRTMTIIVHISDRGWVSILLLSTDFLTNMFVIWLWRRVSIRLVKSAIQREDNANKFYLLQARSKVVIFILNEIIQGSQNLLIQTTGEVLKNSRDAYKVISNCEGRSIEDRRTIKDLLNHLSMVDENSATKVISDPSKVHVLTLPVRRGREDAEFEINAVTSMCKRIGYTHHGPMDIGNSDEWEEFLKLELDKIKGTAELVLIFLMSHGTKDKLLTDSRSGRGPHVADIVTVVNKHTKQSTEKYLYVTACRGDDSQPQEETRGMHDEDMPVADKSEARERLPKKKRRKRFRPQGVKLKGGKLKGVKLKGVKLKHAVDQTTNLRVHWATEPNKKAFQNSFITIVAGLLSSTKSPVINLHNVSVNASKQCKIYYTTTSLYSSPNLDSNVEILVPQHLRA